MSYRYAALASLSLVGLMVGCYGTGDQHIYSYCKAVERGYVDPLGQVQPCPKDGGAGGEADNNCVGECLPDRPYGWDDPGLLWIGSADEMPPECPTDQAPNTAYEGFADLVVTGVCPTCSCLPPTGSCKVPSNFIARAANCATPGAWTMSFDGPPGWDGACSDVNGIPQGLNCGGSPCVQSLIVEPPQVVESGCNPLHGPEPVPLATPYWKTRARACKRVLDRTSSCGDFEHVCAPKPGPPPPEFRQCVFAWGEQECPSFSEYQDRFVFYLDFQNDRTCEPCTCGAPQGSVCSAQLSVYENSGCAAPVFENLMIKSTDPAGCIDVTSGVGLGSKKVTGISYQPGVCQASGGGLKGDAKPIKPATFCCLPKP